jgi:hypothetical protein
MITAATTTTTRRVANKNKIVGNENGFGFVAEAVSSFPKKRIEIPGQPELGLRCFLSTTTPMSSVLGPFGPGPPSTIR